MLRNNYNYRIMKLCVLLLIFMLCVSAISAQQHTPTRISGKVTDNNGMPVEFANIYIKGTTEGGISLEDGTFVFDTSLGGKVTVVASFMGFEPVSVTADVGELSGITIRLKPVLNSLKEVVVYSGNYQLQSASSLSRKNAVDLATTAGSGGDLIKAISLLPGTQAPGTDGRLLVRGGESHETQSYIDGMHVLSTYTASAGNQSSRSKYSPFLFEGINFSMGGYASEYSQSLSAILPLETKNESKYTKAGVSVMNVLLGGGGTKAWKKGSASFNVEAVDMGLYGRVFDPGNQRNWNDPYRRYSGQNQLRFELAENTFLKTYVAYDKTRFNLLQTDPFEHTSRGLDYDEDNVYLNATFHKRYDNGLKVFAGVAGSDNSKRIDNARVVNDKMREKERELHLKAKAGKRLSRCYRIDFGMESMLRDYDIAYRDTIATGAVFDHHITGAYLSNDFTLTDRLFLNLSSRVEYTSLNTSLALLPRAALSYQAGNLTLSGVVGLYQQAAQNNRLMYNPTLANEKNLQAQIGLHYQVNDQIVRVEVYNKGYTNLAVKEAGQYVSGGDGYSRGVDVFINNRKFLNDWDYTVAYSYNDTKKRQEFEQKRTTPSYVTRHNASITVKYTNWSIRSIIGITNRFASGRPYHDPNKAGYMNAVTSPYNTVDLSYTFLAHKKLIVYASASNSFNRKNLFGYTYSENPNANGQYDRHPVKQLQNQTFYIGFFFNFGKHAAYDASNF